MHLGLGNMDGSLEANMSKFRVLVYTLPFDNHLTTLVNISMVVKIFFLVTCAIPIPRASAPVEITFIMILI